MKNFWKDLKLKEAKIKMQPIIDKEKKELFLGYFKNRIKYLYDDQDDFIWEILNIAWLNILKIWMNKKEDFILDPINEEFVYQNRVMFASYALATTYFENPDMITVKSQGMIDDIMIERILGDLVKY